MYLRNLLHFKKQKHKNGVSASGKLMTNLELLRLSYQGSCHTNMDNSSPCLEIGFWNLEELLAWKCIWHESTQDDRYR